MSKYMKQIKPPFNNLPIIQAKCYGNKNLNENSGCSYLEQNYDSGIIDNNIESHLIQFHNHIVVKSLLELLDCFTGVDNNE